MMGYLKDTTVSILFWVPFVGLWSYFVLGLTGWQLIGAMIGCAILNALFGGLFAKTLDKWRAVLKYPKVQQK